MTFFVNITGGTPCNIASLSAIQFKGSTCPVAVNVSSSTTVAAYQCKYLTVVHSILSRKQQSPSLFIVDIHSREQKHFWKPQRPATLGRPRVPSTPRRDRGIIRTRIHGIYYGVDRSRKEQNLHKAPRPCSYLHDYKDCTTARSGNHCALAVALPFQIRRG